MLVELRRVPRRSTALSVAPGADALAPLRGKIVTTLPLLRGVKGIGAASRGTATLGAAAVLPYRAESFGIFVPDDDPEEPARALACDEHLKAETCRVAGCRSSRDVPRGA